ncbi:MAG: hypothetical protein SWZ49_12225 [Cyanobacteriota bacterium]|nr:hypothetical protein [Cyanobacteriota bacterium]
MKRIIRLNAVENICSAMLLGINQHSLHPEDSLSPQKLTISGASFASPILAFLNTLNKNNVITLFVLNTAFENIGLLNASLPGLLNRCGEALSSLFLSARTTFVIAFEMKVRRKIKQLGIYSNKPQLRSVKAINYVKAKFVTPALLAVHPSRQIWRVMGLFTVIKSWKAKNIFSYLLFAKQVVKATFYYLLSVSPLYPTNLGCSNTKDEIAFHEKAALFTNNLQFTRLLTIFNPQRKVQPLLSL